MPISETSPTLNQPVGEHKNPWLDGFISQVGSLDINPRYLHINNLVGEENFPRDKHTGTYIESDQMRSLVASRLRETIIKEKNFVCISSDVDNLKSANDKISRSFGDLLIRHGIKVIAEAIDKCNLGSDIEIYLTRKETAADETNAWIFGLSEEQIDLITKNIELAQQPKSISNPDFTLSTTAALLSLKSPEIQSDIEQTKAWYAEDPKSYKIPLDLYQRIIDVVDDTVHRYKIVKDLSRLTGTRVLEKFATLDINKLIEVFVKDFGNSRISGNLLETLFKIVTVKTLTSTGEKGAEKFIKAIASEEELKTTNLNTIKEITAFFQNHFGKEE